METSLLLAFGLYGTVLGAIGFLFSARAKSSQDFMLGNRSLNYWVTAIAAHSSDMSIWLFMGFPGVIYSQGTAALWVPIGLLIGMFCSWTYVAPQLRAITGTQTNLTLSAYLEERCHDNSGMIRIISAFFALIFFMFYISSGLVGMGLMFESVFHLNYHVGIFCGLFIAILYTLIGGFVGVAWCDLFQGMFLVIMIVIVPIVALTQIPSIASIATTAALKQISLSILPFNSVSSLLQGLLVAASWGLGYFGQPHILINFMGIDSESAIKKARRVGMIWQFFTLAAATCIGIIGIGFFANGISSKELVFVLMVKQLFVPFFAGLVLCAIIAAGLTTIDTQMLVSASIFAHDIYKQRIRPHASMQEELLVSKIGVAIVPIISFIIAYNKSNSVYGLVEYAWAGLGSVFGPAILFSLHRKDTNAQGVIIGMIVAGSISFCWKYTGFTLPAMVPAFFSNLFIIYVTTHCKNKVNLA